ncbi:MAG: ATP-binding protein [Bacteroidales bacterium]|nr:ATP-binding protein [Bacteroidales bacterium]
MRFYDREIELGILAKNRRLSQSHSVMTTVIGRRRVGKTSLLMKSEEGHPCLYLYVSKDSEPLLCGKFQEQAVRALGMDFIGRATSFASLFEALMAWGKDHPYSLIIDEFQNVLAVNRAIPGAVQDIWDRYKDTSHVNLILCGSMYSMMKRIFENGDEPLYGRRDSNIKLLPFGIATLKEILADYNPHYAADDLLCLYMLTGGVAKYVELLMDAGATRRKEMLDFAFAVDSPLLVEGTELLASEFGRDYGVYFSILQLIAGGMTAQSEIDGVIGKNCGAYLNNLHNDYTFVGKNTPILSKRGVRNIKWRITDPFLRFWFHYIYPHLNLIETNQLSLLRTHVEADYAQFTGLTLEQYFHDKAMQSGQYTRVGNWWNRRGEDEVDMVALNEFEMTGVVAEIKRNHKKISNAVLEKKMAALPAEFAHYRLTPQMLSLEDM